MLCVAIACGDGSETVSGTTSAVDSTRVDASCPTADACGAVGCTESCETNEDCIAQLAPVSPSGTLHVVCFQGQCASAESCVITNAGAPDGCFCGATFRGFGCGYPDVCVTQADEEEPSCQSRCP